MSDKKTEHAYESLRQIGAALLPVVHETLTTKMRIDAEQLEDVGALLVTELARLGWTILPKADYDALILAQRARP